MRSSVTILTLSVALFCGFPAIAQAPATTKKADSGVNPIRLMDRQEVRVPA
jgi:hypothetical protein